MRVAIGMDHWGFLWKDEIVAHLKASGHDLIDKGAYTHDPDDDYPDLALPVAEAVASGEVERGIVVCGSGVGACIAVNKVRGVRASMCHDTYSAHQGVEHDDMNVVCIGGRVIGIELAKAVLEAFLEASFIPEPRFQRRLDKLAQVEKNGFV